MKTVFFFMFFLFCVHGNAQKNIMTVIHCDIMDGDVLLNDADNRFNVLSEMVDSANVYNVKLTIMLNPYFCQIILENTTRYNAVQQWIIEGHEIAGLHRGLTHFEWDGYTNLPVDTINAYNMMSNYVGPMSIFNDWLDSISQTPVSLYATFDAVTESDWKPGAFIQGKGDGPTALASAGFFDVQQTSLNQGAIDVCQVKYYFAETVLKVNDVISLYSANTNNNLGIVSHSGDFENDPTYFINWLNFIDQHQQNATGDSKTASEIVQFTSCGQALLNVKTDYSMDELNIFPNPIFEKVNIEFGRIEIQEIEIYTIGGKLIHQKKIESNHSNVELDFSSYIKGVYLIKLRTMNGIIIKKAVKN